MADDRDGGGGLGSERCRSQGFVGQLELVKLGLEGADLQFGDGGASSGLREFIGVEKDPEFYRVGVERLSSYDAVF